MTLGAINHVALTVTDLKDADLFFAPLLDFLGYRRAEELESLSVWVSESTGTAINLWQARPDLRSYAHKRYAPGLHHLAFNATDSLISVARQTEIAQSDNAFKPDVPKIGNEWRKPTIELTLDQFREHFTYSDERDSLVRIKYEIEHGKVDLTIPTLDEFFMEALTWESLRVVYLDIKMPATSAHRYAGQMVEKIQPLISNGLRENFKVILMVPDSCRGKYIEER